jgi:hypothetical protein
MLPFHYISNTFQDHKAYVTAQYYSPKENVATEGQTRLGLHVQNLPFREQAPSLINSHVRVATQDRIVDALVPNGERGATFQTNILSVTVSGVFVYA